MPDEPRQPQEIEAVKPDDSREEYRSLTAGLISDAATIIGPVAAVYVGHKLHEDKPADPPPAQEQPLQEQPKDE